MDFMARLKEKVAETFPFNDGEDYDSWAARARQQHLGLRALLAAHLAGLDREVRGERSAKKRNWISVGRLTFEPGPRQPCFVCGGYRSVAQAHHILPLDDQFEREFSGYDHEHVWLCPTHHAIIHLWINRFSSDDQLRARARPTMDDLSDVEFARLEELVIRRDRK